MNRDTPYPAGADSATAFPLQLVMGERAAVEIVASFDTGRKDYPRAVEVALGRKGTRDALICTLSRRKLWGSVMGVMPAFMSRDADVKANLEALIAIAAWDAGREDIAVAMVERHPEEHLHRHIRSCIRRGTAPGAFIERMARLDLERCYAFRK